MAVVERLPVLYHSADYIFIPLGSLDPLWYIWKWSVAHVYARGVSSVANLLLMKSLNKTETPIFLSVVCVCFFFFFFFFFLVSKGNLFDV